MRIGFVLLMAPLKLVNVRSGQRLSQYQFRQFADGHRWREKFAGIDVNAVENELIAIGVPNHEISLSASRIMMNSSTSAITLTTPVTFR